MKKPLRIALAIHTCLTLGLMAGCASTPPGPTYAEAHIPSPPPDKALVYVFRKYAEPTAWDASIKIDSVVGASLSQGTFTVAKLKPGTHAINAVWAGLSGQRDSEITLDVKAGETYFIELTGISQLAGWAPIAGLGPAAGLQYRMGSGLAELPKEAGELRLGECCKLVKSPELE